MNRFAFELSSYTLKTFSGFSKAQVKISGEENIPDGSLIFTANHFTRLETIFLPYYIHGLTHKDVWSLAAAELFDVSILRNALKTFGAVSTKDPGRDELILKTLLSSDVTWIIFPEGMMVKNKKLFRNNTFALKEDGKLKRPHTGAAVTALRCEFYRERIKRMKLKGEAEFDRLVQRFEIQDIEKLLAHQTYIIPVNITYYPASPRENILSSIARLVMKEPSRRVMDELMTEGSMLFSNVEINIRFGKPITIRNYLNDPYLESMLTVKRKIRFEEDLSSKQIFKELSNEIMERYMTAVYRMTTLNYDHVMACVLKHFPYRGEGIDIYEFKCKVFYAIRWLAAIKKYMVSDHFYENQIHLLTDDRLGRISNFLKIAGETGVIRIENDKIFKDQAKFITPANFHTIRIENPLLVIANEVEPVGKADTVIKKIAQKSFDEIKTLVKQKLIEKIQIDFSQDYNRFFIDGETKKKRIGNPVFLKNENADAGVLLIHGYMAAPREMEAFAQYLYEHGFSVYVPRLKGHGTAPEDLAATHYRQWIDSAEEGLVILRHTCRKIVVGGFSTGAGIALDLASRLDNIASVFAVAPPMKLKDLGAYFVPAIDTWNAMIKRFNLNRIAKEFVENHPENPHINYVRNPIAGIRELEKLMENLSSRLGSVTQPTLVVQSRKDPVVNPDGTLKLFEKLGSSFKEYYIFDYDRHGILIGKGVSRVYNSIENHIRLWL